MSLTWPEDLVFFALARSGADLYLDNKDNKDNLLMNRRVLNTWQQLMIDLDERRQRLLR